MKQARLIEAPLGRRPSIERRIVLAVLTASLAVLGTAALAFFVQEWRVQAAVQHSLNDLSVSGAARAVAASGVRTAEQADRLLASLDHERFVEARVAGVDGRLLGVKRYGPDRPDTFERTITLPGGAAFTMVRDRTPIGSVLPEIMAICGALFFMATGMALFLGRALARRVIEPVDALSVFVQKVEGEEAFARRAPHSRYLEVARLGESFNGLLDRLQVKDATQRRMLADLTRARDAAEQASVLKTHFLANISHEIRTPLNGVLAMAEVIALDELAPLQRERLQVVRESGQALLSILNDVLDVSKIEAGRLELEEEDFDFAALVRSACDLFSATLQEKGLAFTLEIAPETAGWRRGDAPRLRQILVNLLSNAVKFTPEGWVSVHVRGLPGGAGVILEIADSGVGLSAEAASTVFDKFTQADSSTTRRFGGTGLGLAICRELVGLMEGEITVESAPQQGALFRVALPLPRAQPPAAAPLPPPSAAPRGDDVRLRVLAAEDNPVNQLVLKTVLDVFGVEVEMVEDGARAVAAWRDGDFDLVLMDVQMPVMDGLAATRAIRAAERESHRPRTPIVALSANALTHQVRDYLAAGMDDHVPKPIELQRLRAVLERVAVAAEAQAA